MLFNTADTANIKNLPPSLESSRTQPAALLEFNVLLLYLSDAKIATGNLDRPVFPDVFTKENRTSRGFFVILTAFFACSQHTTPNVRRQRERAEDPVDSGKFPRNHRTVLRPLSEPQNRDRAYIEMVVPVSPAMPAPAFSSRVIKARRPGRDSAKRTAACTLGSMDPGAN